MNCVNFKIHYKNPNKRTTFRKILISLYVIKSIKFEFIIYLPIFTIIIKIKALKTNVVFMNCVILYTL